MTYEIWDTPSGNLLAHFARYGEALDFIRDQIEGQGTSWVRGIALFKLRAADARPPELIADDERLLPLVSASSQTTP